MGDSRTKLIAIGIGEGVDLKELYSIASARIFVILAPSFFEITSGEVQLRNVMCIGSYSLLISDVVGHAAI